MTRPKAASIAVIGSINADTTYRVPHLPSPGETVLVNSRLDAPGGKGANQAAAIAALGAAVDFVGAVGADEAGASLSAGLAKRGVGLSHLFSVPGVPTGSAVIVVSNSGENSIIVHPGANAELSPTHVSEYFSDCSPEIVLTQCEIHVKTVQAIGENFTGTLIVNPAPMPVPGAALEAIIARANILIPNRTELAALAGTALPLSVDDVIACASGLSFSGDLVVTLGSEGALCFPGGPQSAPVMVESPRVASVDTSGAGDAFCGAFAVAIQQGKELVQAVEAANSVASWSVSQAGAQVDSVIPSFVTEKKLSR